jgi:hypothetical protein
VSRIDMNITHGDLNVQVRHGSGGGFAGVARLGILGALAYLAITAILAAIVAIAVALVIAVLVTAATLYGFWRWQSRRHAEVAAQCDVRREQLAAEAAERADLQHQRRLQIAAASAPKVILGPDLLAALGVQQQMQPVIVRAEVEQ